MLAVTPNCVMLKFYNKLQEDPNNTPASARHKRGCNCKKSSCLKKYCECYQVLQVLMISTEILPVEFYLCFKCLIE